MGQCYENEQIKSQAAAIRCYTRAVDSGDREGTAPLTNTPENASVQCHPSCRCQPACYLS